MTALVLASWLLLLSPGAIHPGVFSDTPENTGEGTSITVEATAYVDADGMPPWGVTASGTQTTEGRTIACPPEWAFGTVLEIEGLGQRVCEDRGAAIQGARIDVFMESREDALRWGRRDVQVEVIGGD